MVHTLEFRVEAVLGFDTQRAQITYGTALDGTSAVSTDLPWTVTVPASSGLFVYIQAVAQGENEVRVQIIVDGKVFREATGFSPVGVGDDPASRTAGALQRLSW